MTAVAITALCVKRLQQSRPPRAGGGDVGNMGMPGSCICRQAATNHLRRQRGTYPRPSTHPSLPWAAAARWRLRRQGQRRRRNKGVQEALAGGQRERAACSSSLLQVRPDLPAGAGRPTFRLSGAPEEARGLLICGYIQKRSILFFVCFFFF